MRRVPEREDGFLRAVLELAKVQGWLAFHPRPARTAHGWVTAMSGDAGFPDVVLVKVYPHQERPARLIFAEFKSARGHLSEKQRTWIERLSEVIGIEVYIWYPKDWSAIVQILEA